MNRAGTWVISPQPHDQELLSSYLVRVAHANGKSPSRFCSFHFPNIAIWNRDVDRTASDTFLSTLAVRLNVAKEIVREMTLQSWAAKLAGTGSEYPLTAISPWINALGIYHRSRTLYGLQYCPLCLLESGGYRKTWRLSFVTVCPLHGCSLMDCCMHCSAPIAMHRNEKSHFHCFGCGRQLAQRGCKAGGIFATDVFTLQKKLLAALEQGAATVGSFSISATDLFNGLYMMARVVKARLRMTHSRLTYPSGKMETLRLDQRVQQCMAISQFLEDWPDQFMKTAIDIGLTQRAFNVMGMPPKWLEVVVDQLPPGQRRIRAKVLNTFRQQISRIHRRKAAGWRTERARLLLKKAGVNV